MHQNYSLNISKLDGSQVSFQSEKKSQNFIKYEFQNKHEASLADGIDEYQIINQLKMFDPITATTLTLKDVQIKQLTPLMKIQLEKFKKVDTLNLINLSLKNIKNFPQLPNLEALCLKKNCITDASLVPIIELYPNLLELDLRENRIKCQKNIEKLENSKIEELDLRGNFISQKQFTPEFVFDKIKSLMIFNGKYKDGKVIKQTAFDQQLQDCLSSESSVSFNNPDSDSDEDEKAKGATSNYWYQPKAKRNLRYLKNVTPQQKLRIKKRKSPYFWSSQQSKLRKLLKQEKLQYD